MDKDTSRTGRHYLRTRTGTEQRRQIGGQRKKTHLYEHVCIDTAIWSDPDLAGCGYILQLESCTSATTRMHLNAKKLRVQHFLAAATPMQAGWDSKLYFGSFLFPFGRVNEEFRQFYQENLRFEDLRWKLVFRWLLCFRLLFAPFFLWSLSIDCHDLSKPFTNAWIGHDDCVRIVAGFEIWLAKNLEWVQDTV